MCRLVEAQRQARAERASAEKRKGKSKIKRCDVYRLVEAQRQARAERAAAEEVQQQQASSLQASQAKIARQLQLKAQQADWQAANEKALLEK